MEEHPTPSPEPAAGAPAPATGPLATPASAPTPPARRSGGGCFARVLAALLVVIITTFLALTAGAAGLIYLGYTPSTPAQLAEAQLQVATLQAANGTLQTQVAAADTRGSGDHELLGELKSQVDAMADLRNQLKQERDASALQSATLVAEVRGGRDAVAVFATAEAGRAALLSELERRSARVERFLQRLGDIANDTATDLNGATAVVPTITPTPVALPTATEQPTRAPSPSPSAAPLRTLTPTPGPAQQPTANATPTPGR